MNVTVTKQDLKVERFQVMGQGEAPTAPVQIGEWWIIPAESYRKNVSKEAQANLFALINSGQRVKAVLIAEDVRKIEEDRKRELERQAARQKAIETAGKVTVAAITASLMGVGLVFAGLVSMLAGFDPMLIAVMEDDGRWLCLGEWFD